MSARSPAKDVPTQYFPICYSRSHTSHSSQSNVTNASHKYSSVHRISVYLPHSQYNCYLLSLLNRRIVSIKVVIPANQRSGSHINLKSTTVADSKPTDGVEGPNVNAQIVWACLGHPPVYNVLDELAFVPPRSALHCSTMSPAFIHQVSSILHISTWQAHCLDYCHRQKSIASRSQPRGIGPRC